MEVFFTSCQSNARQITPVPSELMKMIGMVACVLSSRATSIPSLSPWMLMSMRARSGLAAAAGNPASEVSGPGNQRSF